MTIWSQRKQEMKHNNGNNTHIDNRKDVLKSHVCQEKK